MSSSGYSSKSIRGDRVFFQHHSNHRNGSVELHTSNDFDFKAPIKCQEYHIGSKFKLIEVGEKLLIQKKVGGNYQTLFTFGE